MKFHQKIWLLCACAMVVALCACTKNDAPKPAVLMLSAGDSIIINKVRQGLMRGAELCDKLSANTFSPDEQLAYLNEVRVIHKLSKTYIEKFIAQQGNSPMIDSLKNLFNQFEKTAAKYHIAVDSTSQQR
jgi:hypothetical protein